MTYIKTVRPSGTRCYGSTRLATTIKFFTILNDKSNLSQPSAHTKAILRKNGRTITTRIDNEEGLENTNLTTMVKIIYHLQNT